MTTATKSPMVKPTLAPPGSREKLAVLRRRAKYELPLFCDLDADLLAWMTVGNWHPLSATNAAISGMKAVSLNVEPDIEESITEIEASVNQIIDGLLIQQRQHPAAVVSQEPCSTSRNKLLPGCAGGCEWCTEEGEESCSE